MLLFKLSTAMNLSLNGILEFDHELQNMQQLEIYDLRNNSGTQ